MKIECSKEEKDTILVIGSTHAMCMFDNTPNVSCFDSESCEECIEKNIEWVIKEGEEE